MLLSTAAICLALVTVGTHAHPLTERQSTGQDFKLYATPLAGSGPANASMFDQTAKYWLECTWHGSTGCQDTSTDCLAVALTINGGLAAASAVAPAGNEFATVFNMIGSKIDTSSGQMLGYSLFGLNTFTLGQDDGALDIQVQE